MATPDISKLSFVELNKLIAEAQQAVDSKREEELKVLADGYAKKCEAAGFTIQEAVEALKPYWPAKSGRGRGTGVKKGDKLRPVAGTTYKNPQTGETWTRPESGKGRTVGWLQALVDDGKSFEQFVSK